MANFTYNTNVPVPTNSSAQDVADMQTNTGSIANLLAVDHIGFNLANGGFHNQITMLGQAAPGLRGGNGVLYCNTSNGNYWPFWQNSLGVFPIVTGIPSASSSGYTYLPGGLIFQWGRATSSGTNLPNTTVTFSKAYSTAAYSVNCTILTTADSRFFVEIYDISTNQFRAVTRDSGGSKTSGITFCWFAIGAQ